MDGLPAYLHRPPPLMPRVKSALESERAMNPSFEETLIEVWRQALAENAKSVELGKERYPVRRTPKRGLRQVDFVFDGYEIRGLEQNPGTKSRWAQLARSGKKVMQFLSGSVFSFTTKSCARVRRQASPRLRVW